MSEMEEIEVADSFLLRVRRGILFITVKPDVDVDIELMEKLVATRKEIQCGEKTLTFIDARESGGFTKEAREYGAGKAVEGLDKAMAIITNSLPIKIVVNFFIKINQPKAPTKLFESEPMALKWLETYR